MKDGKEREKERVGKKVCTERQKTNRNEENKKQKQSGRAEK